MTNKVRIANFPMEIAANAKFPTYADRPRILAGEIARRSSSGGDES